MDEPLKPGERRLTALQTLQLGEIHLKDEILRLQKRILDLEGTNIDLHRQLWTIRADSHEKTSEKTYQKLGIHRGQRIEILEGGILRVDPGNGAKKT